MALSRLFITIGTPIISAVIYVLSIGYRHRLRISRLRKQGVAMPAGWSWWFGHLRVLDEKLSRLPPDANVYMAMEDLVSDHAATEVFLMDYWPVFQPVLMIFGPELAVQASIRHDLPKPHDQQESFRPVVGGPSLITMNNEQWRMWRSLLSPGFSASHMLSLVPTIVDAIDVFCERLRKHVGGGVFSLDDMATRLAMDVITRTTLDTDLDNQRSEHKLSHALNTILNWHSFWDPRILLNPLRIPVQWYYGRVTALFIRQELQKRFEEMKTDRATIGGTLGRARKAKSVIALALEEYITMKHETNKEAFDSMELDKDFAQIAANQIRLFIFAGNDSTATTIVYTYHMLFQHPSVLAKVREEHDAIFGRGPDAGDRLRDNPVLINLCRYTLAVVKETLRLYPPASSIREGLTGVSLTDREGNVIPTEHLNATIMHRYVHVNKRIWPRPMEFLPERWLVEPGHELHPPSGGYRPFELGPRNCIGQTLVLNELRIALIMTVREFSIRPAYDEWDAMKLANESLYGKLLRQLGLRKSHCKTVLGERAYQTSRAGAHAADGYPCRVSLLKAEAHCC
ncbi:putative cytochrome P450 [Cucurbitaria berberidis CBS 394.84]|uniref:Cytochrome P450 n=1 Tax=Cucurbitaria berberidis CBS 394.84 TaxID=1168544 RepID=A0A9P4GHB2_9PLEO|nr:putative cytochrome P450 [Cucurbitaria berberidis CBS 394.84]KAF1845155.1 putative cytochrome P450 [Cucurbitaria berberidis CBS 394.84]